MTLGAVDYAGSYFKYKTPTPIQGTPTHKSLKRLKAELRANASSVETDLGGGDHGYLGLVLSDAEYAKIVPNAAFIAPLFPHTLVIPNTVTQVEAFTLRDTHAEKKGLYYECKNVEKALQRHVQDALEYKYVAPLVNEDTELIHDDIPTILAYLVRAYGKVATEEVKEKEQAIRSLSFHPADPLILLYGPIEKLNSLATQAGIPYSKHQLLDMGLTVLKNTRDFEQALLAWEAKTALNKTWLTFKDHFTQAQQKLREIRGPTMQQAGFHHANMLASQIRTNLESQNEDMMQMLQEVMDTNEKQQQEQEENTPVQHQSANAMTADTSQLEMMKLLKQMQEGMQMLLQKESGTSPTKRKGFGKKTPDDTDRERAITSSYCWTHGGCGHSSTKCKFRAEGHQDSATFKKRMGGSKAFCKPTTP